ncbi:467_t:CDS:1 [Ambispora leptoticha]|uniref:467_t:CDS:1 n=1 Tax=Ambispora leptoticha TaxID=144679 RepID=A0A9N9FRC8_9GLOM|nr:467_t:CDS:1 [Ambispora leptoticha]
MEINSIFQILPTEIRQEIFKKLNRGSLFNSLLVNRQFCLEIVPILWESPLELAYRYRKHEIFAKLTREYEIIVSVYVGCFSEAAWEYLGSNQVNRPYAMWQPTFKYASFSRHYEITRVNDAVDAWITQNLYYPTDKHLSIRKALTVSLSRLLLNESTSLHSLTNDFQYDQEIWGVITKECSIEKIFGNLKELNVAHFSLGNNSRMFFENLANTCHSIQRITFTGHGLNIEEKITTKALRHMMKAQSELQWIRLRHLSSIESRIICNTLSSKNLQAIEFIRIDFNCFSADNEIPGLSACVNLICLSFRYCTALEQPCWFETAKSFKKLERLSIRLPSHMEPPTDLVAEIVKASGNNLQYLLVENHNHSSHATYINKIFPLIILNSRNLRAINLLNLGVNNLSTLMESCPKLYHLDLYTEHLDDAFFNTLARELRPTIKSLKLILPGRRIRASAEPFIRFLYGAHNLEYFSFHPFNLYESYGTLIKNHGIKSECSM